MDFHRSSPGSAWIILLSFVLANEWRNIQILAPQLRIQLSSNCSTGIVGTYNWWLLMPKLEIYLITLCMHFLWGQTTVSSIRNNKLSRNRDRRRKWRYDHSVTCRNSIPIVEHANARGLSTFVCVTTSAVSPASLTALHSLVSIASESITIINRVCITSSYLFSFWQPVH